MSLKPLINGTYHVLYPRCVASLDQNRCAFADNEKNSFAYVTIKMHVAYIP